MQIISMPLQNRKGFAGRHIVTQTMPSAAPVHAMMTGNGTLMIRAMGRPDRETLVIQREELYAPQWKKPPKAPAMADHLAMIRSKMLKGQYKEAAELADMAASQGGTPPYFSGNPSHPAMLLKIAQPVEKASEYIHTLDMRTGVIRLHWEEDGVFERRMFCSRADGVAVIELTAPKGRLEAEIAGTFPELKYDRGWWASNDIEEGGRSGVWDCKAEAPEVTIRHRKECILLDGVYEYEQGGFAVGIRVVVEGGEVAAKEDAITLKGADRALLLLKAERYHGDEPVIRSEALCEAMQGLAADFDTLLKAHEALHRPLFERLSVDLGGDPEDYLLSTVELKQKQLVSQEIIPAYMEAMVDAGRFFLLRECGKFPPIYGHVNVNVNHQISGGNIGNLPEMMESFFRWIEWQLPDARENAERILGTRGFFIACHPDEESGNLIHFNEFFPHEFWISSSGWCLQPFLEHFYCTGDEEFMRTRTLPLYRELAMLYEDFLSVRDENGYRMFIPSYSPENFPSNVPVMSVINATMDIQVCREVLTTLLTYGPRFGVGTEEELAKWQQLLDELPPYLYGRYGELKEWAYEGLEERYDHRHASHLYGCYPGDEVQPDLDPELFKASQIANRMRALGNESCHGIMHRAQAAARLKDAWLVQKLLRFTLEAGYVTDAFTTVHNPYRQGMFPDGQGALPTVLLESLVYSRPGVIELLPALPEGSFGKGCLKGMASRSFAEITEFSWDLAAGRLELTIRSLAEQTMEIRVPEGFLIDGAKTKTLTLAKGETAHIEATR